MKDILINGLSRRVLDLVATELKVDNIGSRVKINSYINDFSYSRIKEAINTVTN